METVTKKARRHALVITATLLVLMVYSYSALAQDDGDAPRNLRLEPAEGGILLTWDPPAEDAQSVTGYRILRRNADRYVNLGVRLRNTGSADTTFMDTRVS